MLHFRCDLKFNHDVNPGENTIPLNNRGTNVIPSHHDGSSIQSRIPPYSEKDLYLGLPEKVLFVSI